MPLQYAIAPDGTIGEIMAAQEEIQNLQPSDKRGHRRQALQYVATIDAALADLESVFVHAQGEQNDDTPKRVQRHVDAAQKAVSQLRYDAMVLLR